MKDIPLSQDELKLIVGTFLRLSVGVGSSKPYLQLIDKLDPFIDKPVAEVVEKKESEDISASA